MRFAAVKRLLGAVIGAAIITRLALVQAEKNVPLVIRLGRLSGPRRLGVDVRGSFGCSHV